MTGMEKHPRRQRRETGESAKTTDERTGEAAGEADGCVDCQALHTKMEALKLTTEALQRKVEAMEGLVMAAQQTPGDVIRVSHRHRTLPTDSDADNGDELP